MKIKDIKNPWRDKWRDATFRGVKFFVETEARQSGRRIAVHEYPKRNVPYAEDMGRKARRYLVQGYLIGPNYLDQKDLLITALEKDGPGLLRLPLPYQMSDANVMVASYSVTEGRERGGYCMLEMDFVEYGNPQYRQEISTTDEINKASEKVENYLLGPDRPDKVPGCVPYARVHNSANINEMNEQLSKAVTKYQIKPDFMTRQ
jgi:hypothetical protein